MNRYYNLFPGPSAIPDSVLQQIEKNLYEYQNSHVSCLELNHRGQEIQDLMNSIKNKLFSLLKIPDNYSIFFFEGGASLHFSALAMNLPLNDKKIAYVLSDHWSSRAFEEGYKILTDKAEIVYNSISNYQLPTTEDLNLNPEDYSYLHITSNNTVTGTQFHQLPSSEIPLIIDSTSDIMSRHFDFEKDNIGILYAACQKNLGLAGLTLAIVRNDLIVEKPSIPSMLSYHYHQNNFITHTIPVFNIYVLELILQWVENAGGVDYFYEKSQLASSSIYQILDAYPETYVYPIPIQSRSFINIPFSINPKEKEKELISEAYQKKIIGIEGHHTKGGIRLSLYNSLPQTAIPHIVDLLEMFVKKIHS